MSDKGDDRGSAPKTYEPRREARVLWWEDSAMPKDDPDAVVLTAEQRHAGDQLHELLRKLSRRPYQPRGDQQKKRSFMPLIDETRWNQNLLLDGDRGSGKTALLVTLLDLWESIVSPDAVRYDGSELAQKHRAKDRQDKLTGWEIDKATWPIVPVGMVDLQPLPKHTPVLLHIAESLVGVVEAMEDCVDKGRAEPPWHIAEKNPIGSRMAWDHLLRCILARWDYAAEQRWGKMDEESRFHELDRDVREHQHLPAQFTRFLDALVKDYQEHYRCVGNGPPLFVLALDDADMEVKRAREVLDTLRLLSHPRLVFVLTGDSGLFYRAAEHAAQAELKDDKTFASVLARQLYDKVVPPSHRCAIPGIPISDRFKHIPELLGLKFPEVRALQERVSLGTFLSSPLIAPALPQRLRALRDVAEVGRVLPGETADAAVVRVVMHLWNETPMPEATRALVRLVEGGKSVQVDVPDPSSSAWLYGQLPLHSTPEKVGGGTVQVILEGHHLPRAGARDELSTDFLGALVLADNVAFENGRRHGVEELSDRSSFRPMFAAAHYQRGEDDERLVFAWPFPEGRRLLQLCNISLRWDRVFSTFGPPQALDEVSLDRAARWFLTLVTQLWPGWTMSPRMPGPGAAADPPDWTSLAKDLALIARSSDATPDALAYRRWALGDVLLLAAPESGLPRASAASLLDAVQATVGEGLRARMRERSKNRRIDRAREALREQGTVVEDADTMRLLKAIDDRTPDHPWHAFVNPPVVTLLDVPTRTREHFVRSLSALGLIASGEQLNVATHVAEFDENSLAVAEKLARMADSLGDRFEYRGDLIQNLWQRATSELGYEQNLGGRISVDLDGRVQIEPLPVRFGEPSKVIAKTRELKVREAEPYIVTDGERDLPPLLQLLYQLVWDWVAVSDSAPPRAVSDKALWTWRISATLDEHKVTVPWPATPWRPFFKYEQERRFWRSALPTMRAPRDYTVAPMRRAEQICARFLTTFSDYWVEASTPPKMLPQGFNTRGAIDQALNSGFKMNLDPRHPDTTLDALRERFCRWVYGFALLIAPESCAPPRFRNLLSESLSRYLQKPNKNEAIHRQIIGDVPALEAHRLDRMKHAVATSSRTTLSAALITKKAERILAACDAREDAADWRNLLDELKKLASTPPQP